MEQIPGIDSTYSRLSNKMTLILRILTFFLLVKIHRGINENMPKGYKEPYNKL